MDCTRFGIKLNYHREKNNMTEKDLARKLHVPVRSIVKWENSEGVPNDRVIARISDLFGVDFQDYLDLDERHGGNHHFDVDDPEYSPLTSRKDRKAMKVRTADIPNTVRPAAKSRQKQRSGAFARFLSKLFMALAILLFVFAEDVFGELYYLQEFRFMVIPVIIILVVLALILRKK